MRETRYAIASGTLAAIEYGDSKTADLSVVFLHGWLDNAASFQSVIEHLHQRAPELHLCAFDLPGHGYSSHKSVDNFYPFHDYIDDVYQFLRVLSPNKLLLVGHSLGALIASCYSAAFPEQVTALVQIEGYGPLAEAPQKAVERLRQGILSRNRLRVKPSRNLNSLEEALTLRSTANQLSADLLRPIVERGVVQQHGVWQWRHDAKLKCDSLYRLSQKHAETILDQISCFHLIILGENGFRELKDISHLNAKNPAQIETVQGGHHCHLEQSLEVAMRILGVVNKI
ncbi:alpha/beta fold hydrolase [Vibrio vulnificus]|uniref:alpha/beta fold hydrolase n=1 Tax=Vibrio vulnificus TaxID=672 RepID=UPI00102A3B67|nr:alpha/beta hydrolase [Vibrio vulnificus]RZR36911.1 alpha/beta hydrolase [Vibrio vulnificus]HAS8504151.1 alpha/beta hydrolase [Vibrio vulnificus]